MVHYPDKWCVVLTKNGDYKVFASWHGGYLDGERWRCNSGIVSIEETKESFLFHGYSGTVYECHKEAYGTTVYGAGILSAFNFPKILEEEEFLSDWKCITQE